jgi:hypothetical protein
MIGEAEGGGYRICGGTLTRRKIAVRLGARLMAFKIVISSCDDVSAERTTVVRVSARVISHQGKRQNSIPHVLKVYSHYEVRKLCSGSSCGCTSNIWEVQATLATCRCDAVLY